MNSSFPFCTEIKLLNDIFPGKLFAGHIPGFKALEQTEQDLATLTDHNITHIVSLCCNDEFDLNKNADTQRISSYWRQAGKIITNNEVTSFSIQDFSTPSRLQANEICNTLDGLLQEKKHTYLHCAAGQGRTGTMLCYYLAHCRKKYTQLKLPLEPQALIDWLRQHYHPKAVESETQLKWLEKEL